MLASGGPNLLGGRRKGQKRLPLVLRVHVLLFTETNLSSDDLNYHFSTVAENLLASTNDNRTTPKSQ